MGGVPILKAIQVLEFRPDYALIRVQATEQGTRT
jgi:hypothetical protein